MERRGTSESFKLYRHSHRIVIRLPTLDIQISLTFPVVLLFICFYGLFVHFFLAFVSMTLHELGHIIAAVVFKQRVYSIRLLPIGLSSEIDDPAFGGWKVIVVSISGPLSNILIVLVLILVKTYYFFLPEYFHNVLYLNTCLALFNMIPVLPLDGGKILKIILTRKFGIFSSYINTKRISLLLAILFVIVGTFQLIAGSYNFSLLAIGLYIFFHLKTRDMEASLMNIKDIVLRRSRLLKKGIYPARHIVVLKTVRISDTLKSMDFDRFHIVYVLDDNLGLMKSFTEQQIMDLALKYDASITFEELISMER